MQTTVSSTDSVEALGYRQELRRSLTLRDLLVYGLIFIVPGAPISVFGIVYNASAGMVPLVYIVALVAMLFTAASYAAMSRAYPIAGSVYAYAGRAIGPNVGFLAGWVLLLDYLLSPALILILCSVAVHAVLPQVPKIVWIVGFVVATTLVSLRGIETTARISIALLVVQLATLATFIVVAGIALFHVAHGPVWSLKPFYNPEFAAPSLIFGAVSIAVLSFLGFDAISTLAEEAEGGATAVGRATYLSLALVALLFVIQTYVASLFVLDRVRFAPGSPTEAAFYDIAFDIGGAWLKWLLTIPGVLLAGLPCALAAQVAVSRLLFSMARDGRLPKALAHVHPRHNIPDRAPLVVAAVTLALAYVMVDRLELLTSMVNFGALTGFLLLHVSVIAYVRRQRDRTAERSKAVVAAIGFCIVGYVLVNLNPTAKIVGAIWIGVGALLLVYRRVVRET